MKIKICLTTILILAMISFSQHSFAQEGKNKEEHKTKIIIKKGGTDQDVETTINELIDSGDLPEDVRKELENLGINWTDADGVVHRKIKKEGVHFKSESDGAFLGVMIGHKIINENGVETEEGVSDLGIVVMDVVDGSPAQEAGLQSDDIITAIDGVATPNHESLTEMLSDKNPGETVTLAYLRNGVADSKTITLGEGGGYAIDEEINIEIEEEEDADGGGEPRKMTKVIIEKGGDYMDDGSDVVNENVRVKKKIDEQGKEVTITTETITKANGEIVETVTTESAGEKSVQKTIKQSTSSSSHSVNDLDIKTIDFFPNPATGLLTLRFTAPAASTVVELVDMSGKIVMGEALKDFDGTYEKEFVVKDFPKGAYFMTIRQGAKVYTEQVVLE